ncbi:MAG: hypothetical protein ACYDD6_12615, partial [Acidimicrobiales bacterium]
AGDPGQLLKFVDLRYKYASLASTEAIAAPVAAALHVPVSVVLGAATVDVPSNNLLLYVVGTWSSPGFAQELSAAMAQGITSYVQAEDVTYNVPIADRFQTTVVTPASQASPSSPSAINAGLLGLLVLIGGSIVGFGAFQLVVEPRWRPFR